MKLLLLYGTSEGQTRKIAQFVADHLAQLGHQALLVNANDATAEADPRGFDAVIIAASLHAGLAGIRSVSTMSQAPSDTPPTISSSDGP